MGVGWRRFTERVRESTGLGTKGLEPTNNARCHATLREATEFAGHLKRCQKAIGDMKSAAENLIQTSALVLAAPMPQVYADDGSTSNRSVNGAPAACIGGANFLADPLSRLSLNASKRLDEEVVTPVSRWLEVYNALNSRFKELDAMRLEVDSRRHTVHDLTMSVDKQKARAAASGPGDAKQQLALEETIRKLQHKEAKLAQAMHTFEQNEGRLFSDLAELVKDAEWLKSYLSCAMTLQGEALLSAGKAVGVQQHLDQGAASVGAPDPSMYITGDQKQSVQETSNLSAGGPSVSEDQVEWQLAYSEVDLGKGGRR